MNNQPIIIQLESVGSTNDFAKKTYLESNNLEVPLLVTACEQTAGRGRYGKSFYSPRGGLYMSYAYDAGSKHYTEEQLLGLTTRVAEILLPILQRHTSKELFIKPVNDIYALPESDVGSSTGEGGVAASSTGGSVTVRDELPAGSRKIVGILTERVDYPGNKGGYFIVIGIGINCFADSACCEEVHGSHTPANLPADLESIVGYLEPDCSIGDLTTEIVLALAQV